METKAATTIDPSRLLRAALEEKSRKNPGFSLRAFARASGISHTVLSLVLSGKRRMSRKAALQLAEYLGLDPRRRNALLRYFAAQDGKEPAETHLYQKLSTDAFAAISDWYHYAILSALELPGARCEPRWISGRLGIPVLTAKLALERLQRLGLLEDGRPTGEPLKVENTVSTVATRKFHKQLLLRAAESIDRDPIPVRDFSSMTFTMDPAQLEYARGRIRSFRRQLTAELESKGSPGAVYQLTVQLFPLTPVSKGDLK